MDQSITRKEFSKNGTKIAAGAALGVGAIQLISNSGAHASNMVTPWPWPYQALNVEQARIVGHDTYWTAGKGCSYAAFHAIAQQLRTLLPDPWNELPSEIMLMEVEVAQDGAGSVVLSTVPLPSFRWFSPAHGPVF